MMKIDIWLDMVCPWCYIGKRRLEAALAKFEHRDQIEISWRSFQLDPNLQKTPRTLANHMMLSSGLSLQQATARIRMVTEQATSEGLNYHLDRALLVNSFDAHRLIHLAAKHGVAGEMEECLLKPYTTDGLSIGEIDTLVEMASEVGLDPEEARMILSSRAYTYEVLADLEYAFAIGVTGVPFFVIDEKYGMAGAQPSETILQALRQVWSKSHYSSLSVKAKVPDAGICSTESCTV